MRLVSSLALARTREALTNGWDKNDPKDAQIILHMLRIGAVQRYHDPLVHGLVDIQELSKTHEAISRAKTEHWHRLLTHSLPLYFPEAERFRGSSRRRGGAERLLAFLEAFPTPALITALDKEAFIERRVAGRRAQGLQTSPAVRHLRGSAGVDRTAGGRRHSRRVAPLRVS